MMVRMLVVVPDANAVHSDPWLASPAGRKLLDMAASGSCVVVYPQVVIDELLRQRREGAERSEPLGWRFCRAMSGSERGNRTAR